MGLWGWKIIPIAIPTPTHTHGIPMVIPILTAALQCTDNYTHRVKRLHTDFGHDTIAISAYILYNVCS